jgi:hypothetical protein
MADISKGIGEFVYVPKPKEKSTFAPFITFTESQLREWHASDNSPKNKESDINAALHKKAEQAIKTLEENIKTGTDIKAETIVKKDLRPKEIDLSVVPDDAVSFIENMRF